MSRADRGAKVTAVPGPHLQRSFMLKHSAVLATQAITVDLLISFLLAILPILVIFVGLVFLKQSGTLMGFVGWILTVIIAVLFFSTSPRIALLATANGILASFGISLMVLFTILQVTMMDVTGAITSISEYIRLIAAERYEQVMLLNVGLGSFLVSIGATPVTMLPPIMLALGFSPIAAIALPCLGYDPLTSFSLLAVPITLPAQIFNLDLAAFGSQISLFLPVISTGFAFGMLYVADGWSGMRKGLDPGPRSRPHTRVLGHPLRPYFADLGDRAGRGLLGDGHNRGPAPTPRPPGEADPGPARGHAGRRDAHRPRRPPLDPAGLLLHRDQHPRDLDRPLRGARAAAEDPHRRRQGDRPEAAEPGLYLGPRLDPDRGAVHGPQSRRGAEDRRHLAAAGHGPRPSPQPSSSRSRT